MSDSGALPGQERPRFDDGKAADALRTIGEVSRALGIKQHVLRYWEQQFPMLRPLQRSGGRRYYRPEDVALVDRIDRLVNREGYTIKGARQAIERGTVEKGPVEKGPAIDAPSAGSATAATPGHDELVVALRSIRGRLARALEA